MMSVEKFGRYKTEVEDMMERKETLVLKKLSEFGETLGDNRGFKQRARNDNVVALPNGIRENAETAISCRGPGPARRNKEVYQ